MADTNPKKRDKLVDELLGLTGDPDRDIYSGEWSAYWALKWGDLLRNNRNTVGDGGMWAFYNWMRQALRENMPVDQFVREIITAQGGPEALVGQIKKDVERVKEILTNG